MNATVPWQTFSDIVSHGTVAFMMSKYSCCFNLLGMECIYATNFITVLDFFFTVLDFYLIFVFG